MNMRSLAVGVLVLIFALPVAAQTVHQATPVDQLLAQYWAAHPEMMNEHHNHHSIADMEPAPTSAEPPATNSVNASATKSFTIVAEQWKFTVTPSPFVVNQGDSVTLDITSKDVTHGFFLEQYMTGIGITYVKNQHKTVTFVANTPGTFTYFCTDSSCGSGHAGMNAEMTVNAPATPPAVSSFTPQTGPTSGGTVVAITGSNFQNGAAVKFGDASAVSVNVNSATSISAMSPVHAAGDVTLVVTNPDGQSATAGTFTYAVPGPTISSITPSSGSNAGGTAITINGANFTGSPTVTIGGASATISALAGSTTIFASTPPGPLNISGNVPSDVVVRNPDGRTATASGGFTYTLPAPAISSISPSGAAPSGGTTVVISGAGFTTGLPVAVTFGGVAASSVTVISPTSVSVVVPAHAVGAVDVVVTVGSNSARSASGFTYQTPSKKRRAVKPQ